VPPHEATSFNLPHPVLTKTGDANTEPTFVTILATHIERNTNAASIYSTRGYGLLGHLILTINAINYISRSKGNVAFDPHVNPPSVPVHKDKATEAEIAEENRQHKARHLKFVLRHNFDAMLRNLIIAGLPGIFPAAKKHPATGFGNMSCLELLTHLHDMYGHIMEKELEDKVTLVRTQWNSPTATESLLIQIKDRIAFAAEGKDEPTKPTILRWAYDIIAKTGHYDLTCREWRQLDTTKTTKE
jgi:hypothetical protein